MTDSMSTHNAPDGARLTASDTSSAAAITASVRSIRNWLIVLTVLMALTLMTAVVAVVVASVGVASLVGLATGVNPGQLAAGFASDDFSDGPPLTSIASLPVDASGQGAIQGTPTGESSSDDQRGTFGLVLVPAPAGLPPRTTLQVSFDRTTKVYRNGQALGDALAAVNDEEGSVDADPSAAGTVKVRFRIKDGRVFAERLDLSDEYPPGVEP